MAGGRRKRAREAGGPRPAPPIEVNGWKLYTWAAFRDRWDGLVAMVEALRRRDPLGYTRHPQTRFLARLRKVVMEDVPRDPGRRAAALSGAGDSAHLAYGYAVTGRRAEAERVVRSLVAAVPGRYVAPLPIAMAYAGLGDADSALAWLERGYAERAVFAVNVTPAFDRLHGDPRWERLLRRMRLAPRPR